MSWLCDWYVDEHTPGFLIFWRLRACRQSNPCLRVLLSFQKITKR